MALRLWSRRASGLSHLLPACQLLCNNLSTAKTYGSAAAADGHAAAASEEPTPTSDRRKERLSRQERTALVESFVLKHMEAHGGAFPSVSVVLKETGGGRSAVKDILSDVESRLTSEQASSDDSRAMEEDSVALSSGTSSSEDSNDDDDDAEEFDTEGVIVDELGGIPEKSVTFTNGQMIGSSHGEIETHSGLWSRLRKLGSQEQRSVAQDASSNGDQDVATASVALSFSDVADLDIRKEAQKGDSNEQEPLNPNLEERHGLFVRYLSPQATPADLKEAFSDCGEIIRAQAIKPRTHQKFTYGFVDFKTSEGLQKALEKDKVYIKGVRIRKEPSSSAPKTPDRNGNSNPLTVDFSSSRGTEEKSGSFLGPAKTKGKGTGYTVAVEGVPLHIPLTVVKKALSKFGEIALSSRKLVGQGDYAAHVEFKGDDARTRALSAKTVQLSGMHYTILRVDPVKTSVVRLSNVAAGMSAEQIKASCEQIGRVDKVVTRCDGIVDVYFHSTESENMPRIMNSRLNEVKAEGQFWQAQPSSCIDPRSFLSLMRSRNGQEWLQEESERMLGRIENSLRHLVVDVEDLQNVVKMKREYTAS